MPATMAGGRSDRAAQGRVVAAVRPSGADARSFSATERRRCHSHAFVVLCLWTRQIGAAGSR
jgi:hypothetical protein